MNIKRKLLFAIPIIILLLALSLTGLKLNSTTKVPEVTEKEAIMLVKSNYSGLDEYKKRSELSQNDYINSSMQYIYTNRVDKKWKVAFVQHGSGINITDIRGFEVDIKSGKVEEVELKIKYEPSSDYPITDFLDFDNPKDFNIQ